MPGTGDPPFGGRAVVLRTEPRNTGSRPFGLPSLSRKPPKAALAVGVNDLGAQAAEADATSARCAQRRRNGRRSAPGWRRRGGCTSPPARRVHDDAHGVLGKRGRLGGLPVGAAAGVTTTKRNSPSCRGWPGSGLCDQSSKSAGKPPSSTISSAASLTPATMLSTWMNDSMTPPVLEWRSSRSLSPREKPCNPVLHYKRPITNRAGGQLGGQSRLAKKTQLKQ